MQSLKATRHKVARWLAARLRRWAEQLDPPVPTVADGLMPLARRMVGEVEQLVRAGSIRHLVVMKAMEKDTGASRLDINEAIERAVRERRR